MFQNSVTKTLAPSFHHPLVIGIGTPELHLPPIKFILQRGSPKNFLGKPPTTMYGNFKKWLWVFLKQVL